MGSQSEDIKCDKTVALTNTSKCNRFIFDVTLEISYVADARWNYDWQLWQTIITTITCQIRHKYKNWKKCSYIIDDHLMNKFAQLRPSTEWKGTISVTGQYHDTDSVSDYSEIIYDWFCYDGYMTVPKNYTNEFRSVPDVYFQYTMRFLLRPALPAAQSIYCAKGYEKITYPSFTEWKKYENIFNTEEDQKKEYNHLKVWQAACKTYNRSK